MNQFLVIFRRIECSGPDPGQFRVGIQFRQGVHPSQAIGGERGDLKADFGQFGFVIVTLGVAAHNFIGIFCGHVFRQSAAGRELRRIGIEVNGAKLMEQAK